jgi:PPOX class probable F420-dependent enzyme
VTFVVADGRLLIGVDEKPKSSANLRRLRNIDANEKVAVLWDRYSETWSELWWVRADGTARISSGGVQWEAAWTALNEKYGQYQGREHLGPVIVVTVHRWSGWSFV